MTERGYVILATNELEYKQAAALAYSIKSKMQHESVTIAVPDMSTVNDKWLDAIDNVVELPFTVADNRRQNDWQLYWATPYKYTIAIDCKTLVKESHATLWDYLIDHYDMCIPVAQFDFRGLPIVSKFKQSINDEYPHIPVVNSDMFFFAKDTELALSYFKFADVFMQNWFDTMTHYVKNQHYTEGYDADVMHMFVAQHFGNDIFPMHNHIMSAVNMKSVVDNRVLGRMNKWTDRINIWASNNAKIKIQNFAINSTLHYHEDDFLTEDIFNEHRQYYKTITKDIKTVVD